MGLGRVRTVSARSNMLPIALCLSAAVVLLGCTTTRGCRREPTRDIVAEDKPMKHDRAAQSWTCPASLLEARRGGSDPDRYVEPSEADRSTMAKLAARLMTEGASALPTAASDAAAISYRIEEVREMPGVVLLRELDAQRRGGGAYMFRLGASSRVVVQATHTFFDEGTLPLACELFQRASAQALFIDTAHRYKAAEIDEQGNHPADIAHARESLFQAATEGLLQAMPKATVVQLHGFAPRELDAAVVLSSGVTRNGDALATRTQQTLAVLVAGRIARFPDETNQLGGTGNVQGTLVRAAGGSFLHVEIVAGLRKTLLEDAGLRARFLDALAGSLSTP
jgi:hypothetical protein